MGYKEKTGTMITFDTDGMIIEGTLVEILPSGFVNDNGVSVISYLVLQKNGKLVQFLGTTMLERLLSDELNSKVRITYLGEAKSSKGRTFKNFKIEVDDGK